jgi:hypothetical protein
LGVILNLEPTPIWHFFAPSELLFVATHWKKLKWSKKKKTKLRPNSEFGARPMSFFFFFFCFIWTFLDVERNSDGEKRKSWAKVQLQQKNELSSFFYIVTKFFSMSR